MGTINHREERKRYFQDGEKWFCETTIFCHDTQTVDRSWVKEVSPSQVPLEMYMESERILPADAPLPEPAPELLEAPAAPEEAPQPAPEVP